MKNWSWCKVSLPLPSATLDHGLTATFNLQNKNKTTGGSLNRGWTGLKPEDLISFNEELAEKFKRTPYEFQREAIKAQLLWKDVLVHAGTGSGKTLIAAGPHTHPLAKGLVTFIISPLIALQEEQVSPVADNAITPQCLTIKMKGLDLSRWFQSDCNRCELDKWRL
jgi:hypothetical protein